MGIAIAITKSVGPIQPATDVPGALAAVRAGLAALRASQCYKQYQANGTLPRTKIGECERDLLSAIAKLGG